MPLEERDSNGRQSSKVMPSMDFRSLLPAFAGNNSVGQSMQEWFCIFVRNVMLNAQISD